MENLLCWLKTEVIKLGNDNAVVHNISITATLDDGDPENGWETVADTGDRIMTVSYSIPLCQ